MYFHDGKWDNLHIKIYNVEQPFVMKQIIDGIPKLSNDKTVTMNIDLLTNEGQRVETIYISGGLRSVNLGDFDYNSESKLRMIEMDLSDIKVL